MKMFSFFFFYVQPQLPEYTKWTVSNDTAACLGPYRRDTRSNMAAWVKWMNFRNVEIKVSEKPYSQKVWRIKLDLWGLLSKVENTNNAIMQTPDFWQKLLIAFIFCLALTPTLLALMHASFLIHHIR